MQDLKDVLEKLIAEAAECELIANLSTLTDKQDAFRSLAVHYRTMAADIRKTIAERG